MAQRVIANIDGSKPVNEDDGKGIGPVGKANALGVALATLISGIVVAICLINGIVLDPTLVSTGTGLLAIGLGLVFTYFTPSKTIIQIIEVVANKDVDGDDTIGPGNIQVKSIESEFRDGQ